MSQTKTVGILIFDGVEVLDFCGPFEVFSVASPPGEDRDQALFTAYTIAPSRDLVTCAGGLLVQPHYDLSDHPRLDIVVIPGGQGTRRERLNQTTVDWIMSRSTKADLVASVCTGSLLMGEAGLLDGGPATTHWAARDLMRELYPTVEIVDDVRVVDRGHIITSAGISAGIDMALHVVERLFDLETAQWTARKMEYEWSRPEVLVV